MFLYLNVKPSRLKKNKKLPPGEQSKSFNIIPVYLHLNSGKVDIASVQIFRRINNVLPLQYSFFFFLEMTKVERPKLSQPRLLCIFCQQPSSTDNLGDMKQADLNCVGTNFVAFV